MTKRVDRLLRIDQAAERLNCSERTLYRIVADGELLALKVRQSLRILESSLEAYIQKQIGVFQSENGFSANCDTVDNG